MSEKGQNVKVVLRCRPMSAKEAQTEKPVIKITSEHTADVVYSSMGKTAKKAYTFDGVYDEKTTQEGMYDSVVRPVVEEVLSGYNCTVFAYGQTGTGKTYTMEGNLDSGNMSKHAGFVPRAVKQVFDHLEANDIEYTVRLSVVELYNEELSDLIAAAEDEGKGVLRKLRLLEDPKKGVVLQGVEERPVNSAKDIYDILQGTNKQRRTAETLCNKQSSRSHSIFTLRIFMKDRCVDEEERILTGTLNLVDLAGSECVGRSGAVGDRKKEAGQINQSLLTLGRVITALVDHQPHIPYRESKLTRLLQESLGGKTKTLIIATVSPSSGNIEETMGTLEYACRAKNIKNTPEINQVQTKKTMMREIAKQVADLQEQLKSQREGNGVYLPNAKYEAMQEELTKLREAEAVLQAEIEEKIAQYNDLDAAFKDTQQELATTEKTLRSTEGTLKMTEACLTATKDTLLHTEVSLNEQNAILTVTKATGDELYKEGSSVLDKGVAMRDDIGALHSKIDRHDAKFSTNLERVEAHRGEVDSHVTKAHSLMAAFSDSNGQRFQALERMVAEFVVSKDDELASLREQVASLKAAVDSHLDGTAASLSANTAQSGDGCDSVTSAAQENAKMMRSAMSQGVAQVSSDAEKIAASIGESREGVLAWAQSVVEVIKSERDAVEAYKAQHEAEVSSIDAKLSSMAEKHSSSSLAQSKELASILAGHDKAMEAIQKEVTANLASLLSAAFAAHTAKLTAEVESVAASIDSAGQEVVKTVEDASACLQAARGTRDAFTASIGGMHAGHEETSNEFKTALSGMHDSGLVTLGQLAVHLEAHQAKVDSISEEGVKEVSQMSNSIKESAASLEKAESARDAEARSLQTGAAEAIAKSIEEAQQAGGQAGSAIADELRSTLTATEEAYINAQSVHTDLRNTNTALSLSPLAPTGATPIKQDLPLPTRLPAFRNDLDILSDYHTANPSHLAPTLNPTFQPLVATPTPPSEDNGSDASPPEADLESMPSPVESLTGSSRSKSSLSTSGREEEEEEGVAPPPAPAAPVEAPVAAPLETKSANTVGSRIRPPSAKTTGKRTSVRPRSARGATAVADKENLN